MKPMHGLISRRLQGACVSTCWRFAAAVACLICTWCGLATGATAQGAAKPEVVIAKEINISLSVGKHAVLRQPLERLDHLLFLALNDEDIPSEVKSAAESASGRKYTPPGDDDLSFSGDADDEIVGRISDGFPGLAVPLVLMTVAERGPYVIAAAYVFAPNDKGGGTLRRVGRHVSTDANVLTVEKKWPECFAKAIRAFVKSQSADGSNSDCQQEAAQTARPQGTNTASTAPKVAVGPSPTPTKPKKGLLDDDPAEEGVQVIIPPLSIDPNKTAKSSNPTAPKKQTASADPNVQPVQPPGKPPPNDPLLTTKTPSVISLVGPPLLPAKHCWQKKFSNAGSFGCRARTIG